MTSGSSHGLVAWLRAFVSGDGVTQTVSPTDSGAELANAYDTVGLVAHRVEGPVLAAVAAISRSHAGRAIPDSVLDVLGETLLVAGDAVGLLCRESRAQ